MYYSQKFESNRVEFLQISVSAALLFSAVFSFFFNLVKALFLSLSSTIERIKLLFLVTQLLTHILWYDGRILLSAQTRVGPP